MEHELLMINSWNVIYGHWCEKPSPSATFFGDGCALFLLKYIYFYLNRLTISVFVSGFTKMLVLFSPIIS